MDRVEKSWSSKLDRMEERLGIIEQSCLSIDALVWSIKTATDSSTAMRSQIFKSDKINI